MIRKFFKNKNRGQFLDPDEIFADSMDAVGSLHSADSKLETPLKKLTSTIFLFFAGAGFIYLIYTAYGLQIFQGVNLFAKSEENRFLVRPVFAARSMIYDQYEKPLVENHPSFTVSFRRDDFSKSGKTLGELLNILEKTLNLNKEELSQKGFSADKKIKDLPRFQILREGITPQEMVSLASQISIVPGIEIFEDFRRFYKSSQAFSHLLGFVGKVSENDILKNSELKPQDTIGKSGVEAMYDSLIRGKAGKKIVEVDAAGRETRFRLVEEPEEGNDIKLTIDGELQKYIYGLLEHYIQGRKGASVVALDPRDGAIRALVSYPGFDSNRFGYSLTQKEFDQIRENPLKPFFNRAISGEFPSGSVIKPIMGAAALQENIIDPDKKIYDAGFIEIPNPYVPGEKSVFVDWKKHGWINFYDAIALSANVYFYIVGGGYGDQKGLGVEKIKQYAKSFGFGSLLGVDLPGEKSGLVPDPEWKKTAEPKNPIWRVGDTYNLSIGQGGFKVTPLQMAAATAAVANGGILYQPHVFEGLLKEGAREIQSEFAPKVLNSNMVSKENLEKVKLGMRQTVTSGTARLLNTVPEPLAAKTGTAQWGSGSPHAWLTVFGPTDNPTLVLAIMVEQGGEGAIVGVPIARDIFLWYFGNRTENIVEKNI